MHTLQTHVYEYSLTNRERGGESRGGGGGENSVSHSRRREAHICTVREHRGLFHCACTVFKRVFLRVHTVMCDVP